MRIIEYLRTVIQAQSEASSKRFIVVVLTIFFCIFNFVMLVLLILTVTRTLPAGYNTIERFFDLFELAIEYDFYIICFGIGAIAVIDFASFLKDTLKSKFESLVKVAKEHVPDTVVNQKVDKQEVNVDNAGGTTIAPEER